MFFTEWIPKLLNLIDVVISGTPADNELLAYDSTSAKWINQTGAEAGLGGGGDVTGPASSVDNAIARFDSTTGKIIQDYTSNPPTISDTGDVNIDGDLDVENIVVSGTVDGVDIATRDHAKYTDAEAVTAAKTVKLDDFTATDDNTDLDFSTTAHGLTPKGTNVGNFLKDDGSWAAPAGGGDVTGPGSSTDNAIARYHETSGKVIQDYTSNPPTISDTGDVNIDGDLDVENIVASGNVDGRDISADGTKLDAVVGNTQAITHAITDNKTATIDGTANVPVDGDYAKFTALGLEGMNKTQILSDINVADGADVTGSNTCDTPFISHKDTHDPNDGGDALDTANAAEIAGVQAAGTGTSHSLARADHAHQIQAAISDNHLLTVDQADAADDEYARFTAAGIESRSIVEVLGDIGVTSGADVTADNAPQAHEASHDVGAADTVFPADPNADKYLMWDDDPGALVWADTPAAGVHKDQHDPEDGADALDTAAAGTIQPDDGAATGTAHSFARSDHTHAITCDTPNSLSAVQAGAEGSAYNFARSDHDHAIAHAISDNSLVTVDGTANDDEYARFTANGLEGRTEAEFKGDFSLAIGTDVLAEQTIGIADDNLVEVDGSPNAAEMTVWTASGLDGKTYAEMMALMFGTALPENTGIILDAALSADQKWSGIVEAGTAGATLDFGDCVYQAIADSRWELAKADVAATSFGKLGINVTVAQASDGGAITVLLLGKVRSDADYAFTVLAPVFISAATAGDLTSTAPTGTTNFVVRIVGYGNTADELYFCPDNTYLELA